MLWCLRGILSLTLDLDFLSPEWSSGDKLMLIPFGEDLTEWALWYLSTFESVLRRIEGVKQGNGGGGSESLA